MKTQVVVDPPVGKKCAQCGKRIKMPKPIKGVSALAYIDPFCSNVCCRKWHGLPMPTGINSRKEPEDG